MIAIAFSLRGTLTRTERLERDAFLALVRERCAELGVPYRDAPALAAADGLFPAGVDALVAPEQLAAAAIALLDDTAPGPVLVARFRQIADRLAQSAVTTPPDTRETLERIASLGVPTAVLCNGWSRIAKREAECAGFTGPVLASEDIGAEKPAPRAFERLVDTIGLPADRIWFVGNDPERDIDGAARAGLSPVWYNPAGASYPAGLEPPMLTVRAFADLLPPLCEEYTRSLLSLRHLMRTALEWRDGHFVPAPERP
jgi:putative hydrolase of the HAD superfamily